MHPIRQLNVPGRLQLDVLNPGRRLVHPENFIGIGGDGREIGVDHLHAVCIDDRDMQEPQPCRRLHLNQFTHRRVERFAHRQLLE
jgi:hypothetical protein